MTTLSVLFIGLDLAIKSSRAQELKSALSKGGKAKIVCAALPEDLVKLGMLQQKFDFWIFIAQGSHVPAYPTWKHFLSKQKEFSAQIAIVSDRPVTAAVSALLDKPWLLIGPEAMGPFCTKILKKTLPDSQEAPAASLTNRAETLSHTAMAPENLDLPVGTDDSSSEPFINEAFENPLDELVSGLDQEVSKFASADSHLGQSSDFDDMISPPANIVLEPESDSHSESPSESMLESTPPPVQMPRRPSSPRPTPPKNSSVPPSELATLVATSKSPLPESESETEDKAVSEDLSDEEVRALSHSDAPIEGEELAAPVANLNVFDLNEETKSSVGVIDPIAENLNNEFQDILEPGLANLKREEMGAHDDDRAIEENMKTAMRPIESYQELLATHVQDPEMQGSEESVSLHLPGVNHDSSSPIDVNRVVDAGLQLLENNPLSSLNQNEIETLKRYAALKERESRERDATIQVLNKQLIQLKDKVGRSEVERRRLQVLHDETLATLRALEDSRDQHQNQLKKVETQQAERLKTIQLKLDNAQFMSTRAERKLEEFRNRVRSDILRIRLRERELSNKLELQKRDAEALLSSKDERLLEQKREIDRLEYEMDLLKERMVEDTDRAEERSSKLSRALQSLKMAQGVLSGIEEEVIPTSQVPNDDDNQAA